MSDGNCSLKSEHVPECDLLLDLFGGVGYVSKYIRGYGWQSENFDVVLDPTQDITNGSTLRSLLTRIRNREFSAIMIGMPCTSFSVARDRTCQIRSMLEPWGLLNQSKFSEKDIKSLRNGNSIAKAVIKILYLIMELRIPAILENPRSSRFWHLPQVKRIAAGHAASFVTCDLCQFGTKWRKRTGLLCLNLDPKKCSSVLSKMCRGSNKCCSCTNRPHLLLSGSSPMGVPWTRLAQVYPKRFASALAKVLALAHDGMDVSR